MPTKHDGNGVAQEGGVLQLQTLPGLREPLVQGQHRNTGGQWAEDHLDHGKGSSFMKQRSQMGTARPLNLWWCMERVGMKYSLGMRVG